MANKLYAVLIALVLAAAAAYGAAQRITAVSGTGDGVALRLSLPWTAPLPKPLILTDLRNPEALALKRAYRYVFDVPAVLNSRPGTVVVEGVTEVKIAQNTPETVRLVVVAGSPLTIDAAVDGPMLLFRVTPHAPTEDHEEPAAKEPSLAAPPLTLPLPVKAPPKPTIRETFLQAAPKEPGRRLIVVDAGHGGKDTGAIGFSQYREKDVVLDVSLMVAQQLRERGYNVAMTRSDDRFIELKERTAFANDRNADLFVCIHANAVANNISVKGIESYFLSPARSERAKRVALKENMDDVGQMHDDSLMTFLNVLNKEKIVASHKLAIDIQSNLLSNVRSHYDVADNGVREAPFWVLVGAQMPAVLVELGYITNPTEAERLVNPVYQKMLAEGIVAGIEHYFRNN